MDSCIQCSREPEHGQLLLTRRRPLGNSEYQIYLPCARKVKAEHSTREKSTQAHPTKHAPNVLPAPNLSPSRAQTAKPGSTAAATEGDLFSSGESGDAA